MPQTEQSIRPIAPPRAPQVRRDFQLRAGLGRATSIMVFLTLLASATNYASNIVFSHLMSTAEYGDFTALIAVTVIAAVPTAAAQTMVAERIATHLAQGEVARARYLIRHAAGHVMALAIVLGLVYAACIPLVKSALGLQSLGPALALGPLLVLSFILPVACGVLQGMERFAALGLVLLVVAASRIGFGVPWTLAGGGAGGPLFGQALGTLVALGAIAWLLRGYVLRRGTGAASSGFRRIPDRRTLAAGGAFTAFALLSNLDLLLAKLLLSPHAAGEYAALATIEKIIIFLPSAIAVVMVPSAAKMKLAEGSAAKVLRVAALLLTASTLIVAVPAAIAPHLVLETMFGAKYLGAVDGVLPIVVAGVCLSLVYLLVVYTVAIQDRRWVWLLIGGVFLQVCSIGALHSSPVEIATVQAAVVAVVLVANEFLFHPILRAERLLLAPPVRRSAR